MRRIPALLLLALTSSAVAGEADEDVVIRPVLEVPVYTEGPAPWTWIIPSALCGVLGVGVGFILGRHTRSS